MKKSQVRNSLVFNFVELKLAVKVANNAIKLFRCSILELNQSLYFTNHNKIQARKNSYILLYGI